MKLFHKLPSATWANGSNLQIPIKDIPALAKVRAFVFRLEGVFTTGAAAAAVASTQLHRLISMIDIGPETRGSGAFWNFLEWQMRGGHTYLPAGLPAANAEVHRRDITWVVPYYDQRARAPADGCPHGADFREKVISIDTAAFASLGAGTWDTLASITGTLRCYALLDQPNESPGARVKFGFSDLTGQAPTLEPGLYTDLFIYRESRATISSAQVTTVALEADGQRYADDMRISEYARTFNDYYSSVSTEEVASATVPEAGYYVPDHPAYTAGAADTRTLPFVPVVYPPPDYKVTKVLRVEQSLRLDYTGSDTTLRVGYRKILPWTDEAAMAAFQRIGRNVPVGSIAAKTDSKGNLYGRAAHFARFLPLRAK